MSNTLERRPSAEPALSAAFNENGLVRGVLIPKQLQKPALSSVLLGEPYSMEGKSFRMKQLKTFYGLLMKNAPEGYQPHFFPCKAGGKEPDFLKITSMAKDKSTCCGVSWVLGNTQKREGKYVCEKCRGSKTSWKLPHARLSLGDALSWIGLGGNVGILGDGILVIGDCDSKKYLSQFKPSLESISRSREGGHFYYWWDETTNAPNIPTDYGEFRAKDEYVLAVGSYVESESKDELSGYYTLKNKISPTKMNLSGLPAIYKEQ